MMATAVNKVANLSTPRMAKIRQFLGSPCADNCNGLWLRCALDVLKRNSVNRYVFADAIRELLAKGRGKNRNIYLMGPANSGKTFILKPLVVIYPEHFSNPAACSFGWLGADEASVIILNDYRWESKRNGGNIKWGSLLNLLEGMETKLPAPMNIFSKHITISSDIPIFGSGPTPIRWYADKYDEVRAEKHRKEDEQLDCRWKTFQFTHRFTDEEKIDDIPVCPACFATMTFLGAED